MTTACVSRYLPATAGLCAWLVLPATSAAHFILVEPPAVFEQNGLGDPQKAAPCGDNGNVVATGIVSSYQGGDTITVTIDETVYHPGHYRIALALDDGVYPEEPPVTPGATPCGSAPIDPAPAFPVLADGVFEHDSPFNEPQSIDITLPDGVSCTHCSLQVIQFMSNHGLNNPGGCYYHHCAAIALEESSAGTSSAGDETSAGSSDGGPALTTGADGTGGNGQTTGSVGEGSGSTDGATSAAPDTDPGQTPANEDGGCSCSLPRGGSGHPLGMLLGLVGLVGLRARRRAR